MGNPAKLSTNETLSIVIPARDEADGLPGLLRDLADLALPPGTEIIVVDDGSTDGTGDIARRADVRVLRLEGAGYGGALKAGFKAASGDWLTFLDADSTYPAATIPRLWTGRGAGGMLMACRFTEANRMPWIRRIGNRVFSVFASLLSGQRVRDLCSGQRIFRRALVEKFDHLPDGLDFSPALTLWAIARGEHVRWIDTAYHDRTGSSKLTIVGDGFRFASAIVRYGRRPAKRSGAEEGSPS